jgi:hypothetical protein
MKMVLGAGTISDYGSYIYNCTLGQYNYKIPVNSLQDVQLYIDIGASAPGAATYELIHTCGATGGTIETLTTSEYVIGQDSNLNYYGVFRNFNETTTATCFVIAITLDANIYFSQEYCVDNLCKELTLVKSCYGNLEAPISYDNEDIYFGQSQGGTQGDSSVVYEHRALLREVKVDLNGKKTTFKSGRTRNFRTESEKIYRFWAEWVPGWYLEHLDAIFERGEVFVDEVKYLLEGTGYELLEDCLRTWRPTVSFTKAHFQSFSCEPDPCVIVSESGSGGATPECCDPAVTGASVTFLEGNNVSIDFTPCSPTPANGYTVQWRVAGSGGSYTTAGPFTSSPAQFTDGVNPEGTQYEGYIFSDCGGGVVGNFIPWSTGVTSTYSLTVLACSGILTTFQISGGTPGDIVTVRASFGGQMQRTGGSFVRADLTISTDDGVDDPIKSSVCYADSGAHAITNDTSTGPLVANSVITMVGSTETVVTNAVVNNSSESLTNLALTIIDINGTPQNISAVGCRGNSSTGGTC